LPQSSRYDAYGEKTDGTGTVSNKYLFAGEQFDEGLGDYYLRARYYDADTGRFVRRDTFEGWLNQPGSLHKYIYANDNPVSFIDPSGYFSLAQAVTTAVLVGILSDLVFPNPVQTPTQPGDIAGPPGLEKTAFEILIGLLLNNGVPTLLKVTSGGGGSANITRLVGGIAQRFRVGQCDDCATAIAVELQRRGISGTRIRIETISNVGREGTIYSKTAEDIIATNGYHEAVVVKINGVDMVFDNIHPQGIPKTQWFDDLETFVDLKPEIIMESW
jgi:RHS repeat-associated protein